MWSENALENYKKNAIKTFQMKPLHLEPTQIAHIQTKVWYIQLIKAFRIYK